MFNDTPEGTTHSFEDSCQPPHDKPLEPVEDDFVEELWKNKGIAGNLSREGVKRILHRHEAHVREKWEREIVENLEYRKYNYEDHICRFNDTPQKCECYGKAIDDNISLITKKV